jgi:polar amino acid transport system substrate-binding protein
MGGTLLPLETVTPINGFRELGVAFTSPVMLNYEQLTVLATDQTPYTTFAEFRDQPVCAQDNGGVYLDLLAAAGVTDVRLYPNNFDALNGLIAGECKAVIHGGPFIRYQQLQGLFPEVRPVETYVSVRMGWGALGVRNTDFELLGRLQAALEQLKLDGTVAEIGHRWGVKFFN